MTITISVVAIAIVLIIVIFVVVRPFGSNAVSANRPSAAVVVESYLSAIADGDAAAAHELDARAFDRAPFLHTDGDSFLTGDILSGASERISEVSAQDVSSTDSVATVQGEFTLSGTTYAPTFNLDWDEASGTWQLDSTVANVFQVASLVQQGGDATPLPFTLAGTGPGELASSAADSVLGYAAYPAVYSLDVTVDESTLADAASQPTSGELVIEPYITDDLTPPVIFTLRG